MEGIGTENHPQGEKWEVWREYLDLLAAHQGKRTRFRVRFFPWSFCWEEPGLAKSPWKVIDPAGPRYNLYEFNPRFWELARRICAYAAEKGLFVEFVLFDRCSLERWQPGERWFRHPWNAACGGPIQAPNGKGHFYTLAEPDNLYLFSEPFSDDWPWAKQSQWFQQRYVKQAIDTVGSFASVYWEIVNEMEGFNDLRVRWVQHWIDFLHAHAPPRPISFSGLNAFRGDRAFYTLPGLDIVQCHGDSKRGPHDAMTHLTALREYGKPVMLDEAFWHGRRPENWQRPSREQQKIERWSFWQALVAGGHTTAVCWQPFEERPIHDWLKVFAEFVDQTDFARLEPHDDLLVALPAGVHAHAAAQPGREYVVYCTVDEPFTGGPLTLALKAGTYVLRGVEPTTGRELRRERLTVTNDEPIAVKLPAFGEDVAVHLRVETETGNSE